MKKIISLFQRNYNSDYLVRDELVPGAEWVAAGEGVATVKLDGTSCLVKDGKLYKRYDAKNDAKQGRMPPEGWDPCEPEPDPVTGSWPGWLPVGNEPEDKWHREAWAQAQTWDEGIPEGTYELVGPKIQSNPYGLDHHRFWPHGFQLARAPRDFAGLRAWFEANETEGIVWRHPDGRLCKIKRRDFGLPWPVKARQYVAASSELAG